MKVLGLISGTSHDGIDAAVVNFSPDGEGLSIEVLGEGTSAYAPELRTRLIAALPPADTTFAEVTRLDTEIGQAFAEAAAGAIAEAGPVDLVVSHGQTVYHWVEDRTVHGTLQIGQPAWIAERTGSPVLADLRIRDIAANGQGAPLASTLDALLLAGRPGRTGALNLGGISNATIVDAVEDARAWDIGPAGALTDSVVLQRGLHPSGYDEGGAIAARGHVHEGLLRQLLAEPYYRLAPPKTTGKELYHSDYVAEHLASGGFDMLDDDLVATLTELTVLTVADALRDAGLRELFVSGGGAHNDTVMAGLRRELPGTDVLDFGALGISPDGKEAVLMALIGWLGWHGVAASVPSATGATAARVLGSFTPGSGPLQLPEPRTRPAFVRVAGHA